MGNTVARPQCVNIEGQEITNDSYTVKRTSGEMEAGWKTGTCYGSPDWVTQHAYKNEGEWRIFMNNCHTDIDAIAQGWRRLSTIYPTRLAEDIDAIEEWRRGVRGLLDELEEVRLQAHLKEKRKMSREIVDILHSSGG